MEVKPITISFKKTEEDKVLFEWILSHSNLSGFVKDILRKEMSEHAAVKSNEIRKCEENELIDLGDF